MTARTSAHALPDFGPGPRAAWTVGTLRAAITGIPDDTLLIISAEDFDDPDFVTEQVIVDAGPGTTDRANGYGPGQSPVFGLQCEIPDGPIELRAGRARALTAHELMAGPGTGRSSARAISAPGRELEAEP
jgi:hypothetical protein